MAFLQRWPNEVGQGIAGFRHEWGGVQNDGTHQLQRDCKCGICVRLGTKTTCHGRSIRRTEICRSLCLGSQPVKMLCRFGGTSYILLLLMDECMNKVGRVSALHIGYQRPGKWHRMQCVLHRSCQHKAPAVYPAHCKPWPSASAWTLARGSRHRSLP